MYLDHYSLNQKPFQISPNPKFLWLGEEHKEALAMMEYVILNNQGFLVLTGDVGTGKTTLINALVNNLGDDVLVATIFNPHLSKLEFFEHLLFAAHLEAAEILDLDLAVRELVDVFCELFRKCVVGVAFRHSIAELQELGGVGITWTVASPSSQASALPTSTGPPGSSASTTTISGEMHRAISWFSPGTTGRATRSMSQTPLEEPSGCVFPTTRWVWTGSSPPSSWEY